MSRSRKHTPCGAISTRKTNKPFKQQEHRRERSLVKVKLRIGAGECAFPHPKQYGNEWCSPRDGKTYWSPWIRDEWRSHNRFFTAEEWRNERKKWMRK